VLPDTPGFLADLDSSVPDTLIIRIYFTLNVTLESARVLEARVTLPSTSPSNVTLPAQRGFQSHTGPLAVKVDAPRRRHGWWPVGHGTFLASLSGLRFSLSLRSLP